MKALLKLLWLPVTSLAAAGLLFHPLSARGHPALPQSVWAAPRSAGTPSVLMGGIAYAPDGRTIACLDGINSQMTSIDLRDSASGRRLKTIPAPSTTLHWLAYLPDGRLFVAGEGSGGNSALWEVRGDEVQRVALPQANGNGAILGLSPDGQTVAVATDAGVLLANLATGKSRAFPTPHIGFPDHMAFTPDGRTLAIASSAGIGLWDLATGELRRRITGLPWWVQALAFSPNGRMLIYTLNNGSGGVFRMDVATGHSFPPLVGHRSVVPDVRFSGDGEKIISCGWGDKTVRIWDAKSGRLQRVLPGPLPHTTQEKDPETGHVLGERISFASQITALALSPDGRSLAGANGGDMLLWDMASGTPRGQPLPPPGHIGGVALSTDGESLFTAHMNGVLVRWNLSSGAQTRIALSGPSSSGAVAVSPDGKTVAVACEDAVLLWDSTLTRQIGALPLQGVVEPALAFSPDGRAIAVTSRNGVQLWDIVSSALLRTFPSGGRAIMRVLYAPDGRTMAAIDSGGVVRLWDVGSGKIRWQTQAHRGSGWAIAFSPSGRFLASGGGDGVVRRWRSADGAASGPPFAFLPVRDGFTGNLRADEVLSIAFSHDETKLAAAAGYGQLKVWETHSRREIADIQLKGGGVTYLAFFADGHSLLVTGYGGLQIYDLRTGQMRSLFTASGV